MGALFLDIRNRVIGHTVAYVGTLTRLAAEPRGLLLPALLANAASVIVFHTHPSGDPSPSAGDRAFTKTVADACAFLGLFLADHLILGEGDRFLSMRIEPDWPVKQRQAVVIS